MLWCCNTGFGFWDLPHQITRNAFELVGSDLVENSCYSNFNHSSNLKKNCKNHEYIRRTLPAVE